jgi:hypothetical protein
MQTDDLLNALIEFVIELLHDYPPVGFRENWHWLLPIASKSAEEG